VSPNWGAERVQETQAMLLPVPAAFTRARNLVAYDYDVAQCQPPFLGFCLDRFGAKGDWDLNDYSRSRAFSRPHNLV
jgi:hypothetical protein